MIDVNPYLLFAPHQCECRSFYDEHGIHLWAHVDSIVFARHDQQSSLKILKKFAIMPRNLPWLERQAKPTKESSLPKQAQQSPREVERSDARHQDAEAKGADIGPRTSQTATDSSRTEATEAKQPTTTRSKDLDLDSSSSSPSRDADPATYSPLRPGYDHDDGWMMVEDELLATAQEFTQHLHTAEYDKQRKEQQAHGSKTSGQLGRPAGGHGL